MANHKKISESTISRLYVYLREITHLYSMNIRTVSSSELSERVNLGDAQIRKDLGQFGQFGTSGSGYDTGELKEALEKILGKSKTWNVAVVGTGNLGQALLSYPGFRKENLNLVAAFDTDPKKIGKKFGGVAVRSFGELAKSVKEDKIAIAIIAVPAENAQEVSDRLIKEGVEFMLNFAPVQLSVPENVRVKNVDLLKELETLSYFLANNK